MLRRACERAAPQGPMRESFDVALHELRDKLSQAAEKIQEQGREIEELRQQRHVPEAQLRA